jgi:hypothetical protein
VDVCPWTAWVSGWTVGDWTHEVWSDMTSVGNLLLQVFTTKGHGRHQVWTQHSPRKPQRYSTHTEVRRLRDSELHTFVETTTIFWQQWNVLIENCIRSNMGPRFGLSSRAIAHPNTLDESSDFLSTSVWFQVPPSPIGLIQPFAWHRKTSSPKMVFDLQYIRNISINRYPNISIFTLK